MADLLLYNNNVCVRGLNTPVLHLWYSCASFLLLSFGVRQAVAVLPTQRHMPGLDLSSNFTPSCHDLSLIW